MNTLIIMRHGQSQWNLENRFTGWEDVALTPVGAAEARRAGELIKDFPIDAVYSSTLKRARRTVEMALDSAMAAGADLAALRDGSELPFAHDPDYTSPIVAQERQSCMC